MSINEVLGAVAAAVGLLILIGGALALVRGSYNKARIQALREDVGDYIRRLDDCEERCSQAEHREEALELKVDHLKSENSLLTQLVTQRADVDKVLTLLSQHHEAAMAGQAALTEAIQSLVKDRA